MAFKFFFLYILILLCQYDSRLLGIGLTLELIIYNVGPDIIEGGLLEGLKIVIREFTFYLMQ